MQNSAELQEMQTMHDLRPLKTFPQTGDDTIGCIRIEYMDLEPWSIGFGQGLLKIHHIRPYKTI